MIYIGVYLVTPLMVTFFYDYMWELHILIVSICNLQMLPM